MCQCQKRNMPQRRRHRRGSSSVLASVQKDHSAFAADFNLVYDQLRAAIAHNESVSAVSLIVLVKRCIRLVEEVSKDSGDRGGAKQELVMALMTRLIADSSLSDDEKVAMQIMLETLGPEIIKLALEGSVLATNSIKEFFKKHCACCK